MSRGYLIILSLFISCCDKEDVNPSYPWLAVPDHFEAVSHTVDNELTVDRWKLGKRLFFDTQFSLDGSISCASCHAPELFFATNLPTNPGSAEAPGTRNSPSLVNIAYHPYFTREGGVATLEMQVLVPVQEENEFNHNLLHIVDTLKMDSSYVSAAMRAYNQELSPFVITRALAVFERTLISGGSPYDLYLQGDEAAISESAKNGLEVFNNVGCGNCHSGLLLTDFEIVNNGIYEVYLDDGLFRLTLDSADIGKFKTPSLRNVVLTGPYMHDGSFATLDEVLDHYASGGSDHVNKSPLISPFTLSSLERENLVYFLESMTDTKFMEWAAAL